MNGGGIYAVLEVVTRIIGAATPAAFVLAGALGFFPLMFRHLWRTRLQRFCKVLLVAAVVVAVDVESDVGGELLYVERDVLQREVRAFQKASNVMKPPTSATDDARRVQLTTLEESD